MMKNMVRLVFIFTFVLQVRYSDSTYTIPLVASAENVITTSNNKRPELTINEPFKFIIQSNTLIKRIVCKNKENMKQVHFVDRLIISSHKDLYASEKDIVAETSMDGTWRCKLYSNGHNGTKFDLKVDVRKQHRIDGSLQKNPMGNQSEDLGYGYGTTNENVPYGYTMGSQSKDEGYGYGTNKENVPNGYPMGSQSKDEGYGYGTNKENVPYGYTMGSQLRDNGHGYGTNNENVPNNMKEKDEAIVTQSDSVNNIVEITTVTHEKITEHPANNFKEETSQSTVKILVVIMAVVIAVIGIILGVFAGTVGRKICCRKTFAEDPVASYGCGPSDPVYEELDSPAAADAKSTVDIAHRAPYPLPPEEREENKKYIHYDTPYDHRFDRPIPQRQFGPQSTTQSSGVKGTLKFF